MLPTTYAVLVLLAGWRVGRLIAVDQITLPLRRRFARSDFFGYLFTCPWCISVWTSPIVAGVPVLFPTNRVVYIGVIALAASGVTGLMQSVEDRLDR